MQEGRFEADVVDVEAGREALDERGVVAAQVEARQLLPRFDAAAEASRVVERDAEVEVGADRPARGARLGEQQSQAPGLDPRWRARRKARRAGRTASRDG